MATRGRPPGFDRDAVLERAMRVFWAQGYEGTSIADLLRAVRISPPSLYAAFGSKEALFREAVDRYERLEGADTERALLDEPTARAAVEAMLRGLARTYANPGQPSGCMIVLGAAMGPPSHAAVRRHLGELRLRSLDAIQHRIERGIADGDVPRGTDSAVVALYCTTVLEGLSLQARDGAATGQLLRIVGCAMAGWDAVIAEARLGPGL